MDRALRVLVVASLAVGVWFGVGAWGDRPRECDSHSVRGHTPVVVEGKVVGDARLPLKLLTVSGGDCAEGQAVMQALHPQIEAMRRQDDIAYGALTPIDGYRCSITESG